MQPIEKVLLPDGFTYTNKTIYPNLVEIITPYLYDNNDYIYLYLKKEYGSYRITDYGDFHNEIDWCSCYDEIPTKYILEKLEEQDISYVSDKDWLMINHPTKDIKDLDKIAKTLSKLSEYVAENYAKNQEVHING